LDPQFEWPIGLSHLKPGDAATVVMSVDEPGDQELSTIADDPSVRVPSPEIAERPDVGHDPIFVGYRTI
jgi:hypothetical protein